MNILLQIQEIVGAPIKDLLLQIQGGLPGITLPAEVNFNGPESLEIGDINLGSSFGNANLGSSDFGSSNFLNGVATDK